MIQPEMSAWDATITCIRGETSLPMHQLVMQSNMSRIELDLQFTLTGTILKKKKLTSGLLIHDQFKHILYM